jgi:hypothetical protein
MIRAHLASFPPRRRLLRKTCEAILPQVDHLFVVLNGYEEIPGYLAKDARVTAVIPDRDVKDAGKFWFTPAPDDIVFTIDDDIGYPPDYVARTLAQLEAIGPAENVVGYQGNIYVGPREAPETAWDNYLFHQQAPAVLGASILGTGTLCARGSSIPPLSEIEPYAGACDIPFCQWLFRKGILPWILPRDAGWLTNDLPRNLRDSSLFITVARKGHDAYRGLLWSFVTRWPHANIRHDRFAARPA